MSLHHHATGHCACDSCDWHGDATDLDQVENLEARLDPGGVVPAGQCPACGALAYLARDTFLPPEPAGAKVLAFPLSKLDQEIGAGSRL